MMVTAQAMCDMRAFDMLEQLAGRDAVMDLIEGDLNEAITFKRYPTGMDYLLNLRRKVNRAIMEKLAR